MVTCNVGYGRKVYYVALDGKYLQKLVRLLKIVLVQRLRFINSWFFLTIGSLQSLNFWKVY
jgi:hypothetical protein